MFRQVKNGYAGSIIGKVCCMVDNTTSVPSTLTTLRNNSMEEDEDDDFVVDDHGRINHHQCSIIPFNDMTKQHHRHAVESHSRPSSPPKYSSFSFSDDHHQCSIISFNDMTKQQHRHAVEFHSCPSSSPKYSSSSYSDDDFEDDENDGNDTHFPSFYDKYSVDIENGDDDDDDSDIDLNPHCDKTRKRSLEFYSLQRTTKLKQLSLSSFFNKSSSGKSIAKGYRRRRQVQLMTEMAQRKEEVCGMSIRGENLVLTTLKEEENEE